MRNNNSLPRKKRHKKIMKLAKGYFQNRSKHFRSAKEAVMHAMENRTISRKILKRDMRTLWISRINSFSRTNFDMSYSKFMNLLKEKKCVHNRKIICDMISQDSKESKTYFMEILNI